MKKTALILALLLIAGAVYIYCSLRSDVPEGATIYVVPVYGQSLALGEEALPVTPLDSLFAATSHRLKGSELNEQFGYFDDASIFRQRVKLLLRRKTRFFETSAAMLGATLVDSLSAHGDRRSVVCTFQAGQGQTGIDYMSRGTNAYNKLLDQLREIAATARRRGCRVVMPAFCWVQGENDLVWSTDSAYGRRLQRFREDLEADVRTIFPDENALFGPRGRLMCVAYQTSALAIAEDGYQSDEYVCRQLRVPCEQLELVQTDSCFLVSTPVYPFTVMREYVHIDGRGQQQLGRYEGRAVAEWLFAGHRRTGLHPRQTRISGDTIFIDFNAEKFPLQLDTAFVAKAENYGFSVVAPSGVQPLRGVVVGDSAVALVCSSRPQADWKVRYGVNGQRGKGGRLHGPRGNLRESSDLPDYCAIFEVKLSQ